MAAVDARQVNSLTSEVRRLGECPHESGGARDAAYFEFLLSQKLLTSSENMTHRHG